MFLKPSPSSRRTSALPTRPRDPATKTRADLSMAGALPRALVAGVRQGLLARRQVHVVIDHHAHELLERGARLPAQRLLHLGRVALEEIDLGRAEIARIDLDVLLPVEPDLAEC